MKVLLTGATGFTGSYVVPLLLDKGHEVACFVRSSSSTDSLLCDRLELRRGDFNDPQSLKQALIGREALINVASLGFGHAPAIVQAAEAAGIRRAIFVSTTAVSTTLNAASKLVRLAAEDTIRQSALAYTILRPTMIYGSPRDRNITRLIRYVRRWPVIPVFGDGKSLQQPVHVQDVANAIVQALHSEVAVGNTYNLSGAAPVTYNELIDTVCRLLNRNVHKIHVPSAPIVQALRGFERVGLRLPIKSEQILRLNENKAFDYAAAQRDFGYQPRTVDEGVRQQIKSAE